MSNFSVQAKIVSNRRRRLETCYNRVIRGNITYYLIFDFLFMSTRSKLCEILEAGVGLQNLVIVKAALTSAFLRNLSWMLCTLATYKI